MFVGVGPRLLAFEGEAIRKCAEDIPSKMGCT